MNIQKTVAEKKEAQKQGKVNASESQIEIDQQYVMPENMDIDIFTSKKRVLKVNDENVMGDADRTANNQSAMSAEPVQRLHGDSATKLIKADIQTATKINNLAKQDKK